MAGRSATRLQAGAHRFLARRSERALRCGQPAGGPAPGGGALAVGCLLGTVAVAGAAVLAVMRPGIGDAPIVLDRASGALYVRVDDTIHPVFNLASARLITGAAADPRPVAGTAIGRARRGPPLGIPGAPGVLGPALGQDATWSMCDTDTAGTTLIAGADPPESARIDPREALPVSSESGITYLLRSGRRVPVNPETLEAGAPRRVSGLLLGAVPEAPPAESSDFGGRVAMPPAAATTLCAHWRADDPAGITLSAGVGLPLPAGATPTVLAQADGPGPALDAVYLPPGRNAYVRGADVTGRAAGAGYLIADTGVRFTVADAAAARSLGLPAAPTGVPWPMLAGLPAGPLLGRQQALSPHDAVTGR